jgi:phosphoribosylformylglycinamidine synthase
VFLRGIDRIELPVAHAEGRLCVSDSALPGIWHRQGQIALAYADAGAHGTYSPEAPVLPCRHNPNGATANIAGLSDPTGRVLGLMPHPERFLFATQHPQWTRRRPSEPGQGERIFRNAVAYFTAW